LKFQTRRSENVLERRANDNEDIVDPKTLEDPVESELLQSHSAIGPNVATTSQNQTWIVGMHFSA
jgi:hypothetical protein